MDEQILSVIEERVAALEKQVFGCANPVVDVKETTIADDLMSSHTMITSALTCRDSIIKVLQRLHELNDYLNPTYPENEVEIQAKKEYIIQLYPELKALAKQLEEYNKLKDYVDSESISKIPGLAVKIGDFAQVVFNTHLQSSACTSNVHETINKYNKILSTLEVLLMQFDQSALEIERELAPKPPSTLD